MIREKEFNAKLAYRLLPYSNNMKTLVNAYNNTKGIKDTLALSTMYKKFRVYEIPLTCFKPGSPVKELKSRVHDRVLSGISINRPLPHDCYTWVYMEKNYTCDCCGATLPHTDFYPLHSIASKFFKIEYVDGNRNNCQINNLRLVCNSCHKNSKKEVA